MASLGIDGLVSGLQTTEIISQLMQIEAAPQTLLKGKQSTAKDIVSALQAINTKVSSLAESAKKAATPASWNAFTATSSSTAATAVTTAGARAGSITFSVDAVARAQVSLSAAVADGSGLTADNPPTLTVKGADGTLVSVTAKSNSLADIASAITSSDAGVTATVVQVSGGATPTYRMQFTSATTGTDGAFEVYAGDEAAVTGGTATRLDGSVAHAPTDATITLWKGTAYEQSTTQSSNTFTGLMSGVDVTVAATTAPGETVTVDVATDSSKVKGLASGLVGALSVVLSDIASRTATTTTTNDNGTTSVKGGLLSGDATIRMMRGQLVDAVSYPVDGVSPSSVGIVLGRDGTVTFDEEAFAKAVQEDPEGTAAFVQELAGRVQGVAESFSDRYEGTLTQKITNQQGLVDDYGKQIAEWDTRLALRRSSLQTTYTNLEVTLSGLNSQSSWLAGQLASLPTSSS